MGTRSLATVAPAGPTSLRWATVSLLGATVFAALFLGVVLATGLDPALRAVGPAALAVVGAAFVGIMVLGLRLYRRPSAAGAVPAFAMGAVWTSIGVNHVLTVAASGTTYGPLALVVVVGLISFGAATVVTAAWTGLSALGSR